MKYSNYLKQLSFLTLLAFGAILSSDVANAKTENKNNPNKTFIFTVENDTTIPLYVFQAQKFVGMSWTPEFADFILAPGDKKTYIGRNKPDIDILQFAANIIACPKYKEDQTFEDCKSILFEGNYCHFIMHASRNSMAIEPRHQPEGGIGPTIQCAGTGIIQNPIIDWTLKISYNTPSNLPPIDMVTKQSAMQLTANANGKYSLTSTYFASPNSPINAFHADKDGMRYFATQNGVALGKPGDMKFIANGQNGLQMNGVPWYEPNISIKGDGRGNVFVSAGKNGLYLGNHLGGPQHPIYFRRINNFHDRYDASYNVTHIEVLNLDAEHNQLYVAGNRGAWTSRCNTYYSTCEAWTALLEEPVSNITLKKINGMSHPIIFLTTNNGLRAFYSYQDGNVPINLPPEVSSQAINHVHLDTKGLIHVATKNQGIYTLQKINAYTYARTRTINRNYGLRSDDVKNIVVHATDTLFVASPNHRISIGVPIGFNHRWQTDATLPIDTDVIGIDVST